MTMMTKLLCVCIALLLSASAFGLPDEADSRHTGAVDCRDIPTERREAGAANGYLILAGAGSVANGCRDACEWNFAQCMKGCDGASQCEAQCKRNRDGCRSGCGS